MTSERLTSNIFSPVLEFYLIVSWCHDKKKQSNKKGRPWSSTLSIPSLSHRTVWTCFKWSKEVTEEQNFVETQGKAFDKNFQEMDLQNREAEKQQNHRTLSCYNTICVEIHGTKLKKHRPPLWELMPCFSVHKPKISLQVFHCSRKCCQRQICCAYKVFLDWPVLLNLGEEPNRLGSRELPSPHSPSEEIGLTVWRDPQTKNMANYKTSLPDSGSDG